jgi:hypothetical protein
MKEKETIPNTKRNPLPLIRRLLTPTLDQLKKVFPENVVDTAFQKLSNISDDQKKDSSILREQLIKNISEQYSHEEWIVFLQKLDELKRSRFESDEFKEWFSKKCENNNLSEIITLLLESQNNGSLLNILIKLLEKNKLSIFSLAHQDNEFALKILKTKSIFLNHLYNDEIARLCNSNLITLLDSETLIAEEYFLSGEFDTWLLQQEKDKNPSEINDLILSLKKHQKILGLLLKKLNLYEQKDFFKDILEVYYEKEKISSSVVDILQKNFPSKKIDESFKIDGYEVECLDENLMKEWLLKLKKMDGVGIKNKENNTKISINSLLEQLTEKDSNNRIQGTLEQLNKIFPEEIIAEGLKERSVIVLKGDAEKHITTVLEQLIKNISEHYTPIQWMEVFLKQLDALIPSELEEWATNPPKLFPIKLTVFNITHNLIFQKRAQTLDEKFKKKLIKIKSSIESADVLLDVAPKDFKLYNGDMQKKLERIYDIYTAYEIYQGKNGYEIIELIQVLETTYFELLKDIASINAQLITLFDAKKIIPETYFLSYEFNEWLFTRKEKNDTSRINDLILSLKDNKEASIWLFAKLARCKEDKFFAGILSDYPTESKKDQISEIKLSDQKTSWLSAISDKKDEIKNALNVIYEAGITDISIIKNKVSSN